VSHCRGDHIQSELTAVGQGYGKMVP
jgi:hypothetical protein